MNNLISAQKLIGSDALELMYTRFRILSYLLTASPAGRRAIAETLSLSERTVRANLSYLADKKLVKFTTAGVLLAEGASEAIEPLGEFFLRAFSFRETEERLCSLLHISRVSVVANIELPDSDELTALGFAAEKLSAGVLDSAKTILVSGDAEVTAMCRVMKSTIHTNCAVLPVSTARDGGELASANALALSKKLKCSCYALREPDIYASPTEIALAQEDVRAVTERYKSAGAIIFGLSAPSEIIPEALSEQERDLIFSGACAAEALGYYVDAGGRLLRPASERGISLNDFKAIPHKLLIAGGAEKKDAIIALCALLGELTLITDYRCACALLEI